MGMNRKAGFTLVEIISVLVIIGIMTAVAAPKFIGMQKEARKGPLLSLKAALESAVTMTYGLAVLEGLESKSEAVTSLGIKIKYGYPWATQAALKKVIDIDLDDWELTGSSPTVTFTLKNDVDGMSKDAILNDADICKLTYTASAYNYSTKQGDRPVITLSGY